MRENQAQAGGSVTTPIRGQAQPAQQPQANPNANTGSWAPTPSTPGGLAAQSTLEKIKSDHLASLPLDQKIALALQKTMDGERVAYRALREVSELNFKLDQIFKSLSAKIDNLGKQPEEPNHQASIFGEEDPESIWS